MTRRPTQPARVLRMLEDAGTSGLTQLDVIVRPSDGGPAILALSQRVGELRARGHRIDVTRTRTSDGTVIARYVLVRPDSASGPRNPAPEPRAPRKAPGSPGIPGETPGAVLTDPSASAVALPLDVPAAPAGAREAMFDIDGTHNPDRGSVRAHNPPHGRANDHGAQPGDTDLVHSRTSRPEHRA